MQLISIDQKTGFKAVGNTVVILDRNLQPFYNWTGKTGFLFNLPAGIYYTTSIIEKRPKPKIFKIPSLPKPEKPGAKLPKAITIKIGDNPHKASIWTRDNFILFDSGLFKIHSKPRIVYIFLHEIGHYFYRTEWKADLFAAVQMLKKGYNPSQIFDASRNSLSKKNYQRIVKTFENLKQNVTS